MFRVSRCESIDLQFLCTPVLLDAPSLREKMRYRDSNSPSELASHAVTASRATCYGLHATCYGLLPTNQIVSLFAL